MALGPFNPAAYPPLPNYRPGPTRLTPGMLAKGTPYAVRPDNRPGLHGVAPHQPPPPRPDNRPGLRGVPHPALPPRPAVHPAHPPTVHPGPAHYPPAAAPAAPAAAPATDPTLAGLLAGYPQPESDAAMQARAQGMIDPLIAQLTQGINQRVTQGTADIQARTEALAQALAPYQQSAKGIFDTGAQETAAVNQSLADRLSGAGSAEGASLADRLKGIGQGAADPAVAAAVQAATQTGAGSGNASFAEGNSALNNIIAHGASAQELAAQYPLWARETGAGQIGGLERQAQNDISSGTQDILAKLPDIVNTLRSSNDAKASNLADTREHLFEYQQGRQDTQAANQQSRADTQAANRANQQTAAATNREHVREFNIGQNNAQRTAAAKALAASQAQDTRLTIAKMATETSVAKQQQTWNELQARIAAQNQRFNVQQRNETARFNAGQQNQNQRQASSQANENQRATFTQQNENQRQAARIAAQNQRAAAARAAKAKTAPAAPKLTALQTQRFKGTAARVADNAKAGFTDSKGVAHPAISAYGALREMRQEGIPDAIAVQAINRAYGTHFNPHGKLP